MTDLPPLSQWAEAFAEKAFGMIQASFPEVLDQEAGTISFDAAEGKRKELLARSSRRIGQIQDKLSTDLPRLLTAKQMLQQYDKDNNGYLAYR